MFTRLILTLLCTGLLTISPMLLDLPSYQVQAQEHINLYPEVDKAVRELQDASQQYLQEKNPRAIFAKVYWRVTLEFSRWIKGGQFLRPDIVAEMVVEFHRLYKKAIVEFDSADAGICQAWQISFEQALKDDVKPSVHLLLGLNAHISHDLPVTFAQVLKRYGRFPLVKRDFFRMNDLFTGLMDDLLSILKDMNRYFEQDGIDLFPFQTVKKKIVMNFVKDMRQRAFSDGLALYLAKDQEQEEKVLAAIRHSALAKAKTIVSLKHVLPYKSLDL